MKKIVMMMVVTTIFYQNSIAQNMGFGFSAEATMASMRSEFTVEKDNSDSHIGFTTGIHIDIGLTNNFSFQPAINFV